MVKHTRDPKKIEHGEYYEGGTENCEKNFNIRPIWWWSPG